MKNTEIDELVGQTLKSVEVIGNNETIDFVTVDDSKYRMYHSQDCCEHVRVEEIIGDLSDLVDTPILMAEESTNNAIGDWGDSATWTFYKFRTRKGDVTIRWLGESNGYYSESVDFAKL